MNGPRVTFSGSVTSRPLVTVEDCGDGEYIDPLGRVQTTRVSRKQNPNTTVSTIGTGKYNVSTVPVNGLEASTDRHCRFNCDSNSPHDSSQHSVSEDSNPVHGNIQSRSLLINLGVLKCGFRFETVIPAFQAEATETERFDIVEITDSLDSDLKVEAVASDTRCDSPPLDVCGASASYTRFLRIRLAARRPGRYQSVFSYVLLMGAGNRYVMSCTVQGTLLRKDQGKPQLKQNIVNLGKLVGYDSDEETDWQGFDRDNDA